MRSQIRAKYPSVSLRVANKVRKLVSRCYILEGVILALISLFYLPKGTEDIHMDFDETINGINDSL